MDIVLGTTKRKMIDIPEEVLRRLSVKAARRGMDLKKYIEGLLARDAADMTTDMDDEEAYRWLSSNDPEGLVPADEKEQERFRKWLEL
ncbi:MAG TPA: hypothetical protein H9848_04095 [Candidatus Parabacteroides intestinigallinarum]|uniref:Uncharacterized protein n=1 Tax=Candidatus Parabacteroides intestinigallinarum TaxID=2838722 RepID=A0A9D1XQJ6_9BACT|nr:hypothetical protein [Candidatus Parabacteroides intestinigallinarum]